MTQATVDFTPHEAVVYAARLEDSGQDQAAENLLRGVIKVEPDNFHAMNRLGGLVAKRGELFEAYYRFDRALALQPGSPMAMSNKAMVLGEFGHLDQAAALFRLALQLEPENPVFWNNLGNTYERMQRYPEALAALDRTLQLDPGHMLSYFNRGIALCRMNRREEALVDFNRAIELSPGYADAHYNRAIARLGLGDLRGGFEDYEWRLKTVEQAPYYVGPFTQPQWTGAEPLKGKTILVHAEQGLGDTIQFMRYLALLVDLEAKVLVIVHRALANTVWSVMPSTVTVLEEGSTYPAFDYWTPLMSLAHAFGTTLETIPPPWNLRRERVLHLSKKFRVGVCWSGNFQHKNDRHRSIELALFKQILSAPNAEFVSLQKDVREADRLEFETLPLERPSLEEMSDTITAINGCDLVITVDTAVAHLAATLGRETWILLPAHGTDWRWLQARSDSPWYPTARLWRQTEVGNWGAVLSAVKRDLTHQTARLAA